MTKICFVSYEIHPAVKGGCGVLLNNTARVLLPQGHEIVFLLDIPDPEYHQFVDIDRLNLPYPERCRAYQVSDLTKNMRLAPEDFRSIFEYRAYRFYLAASEVYRLEQPNIIEFFDYCGVAYFALSAKACHLDFGEAHLAVRLHGALELIDWQQPGHLHGMDRYLMYGLEHQALRLAETILTPSKGFYEKAYKPRYEQWNGEVIVSKPALVDQLQPFDLRANRDIILFYGRLHGNKGVDAFVDAALLYLSDPQNPARQFYLVGYDSHRPPAASGSYQSYLLRKIPVSYQDFFHFTGQLTWQELGDLLPNVRFAVIPSYFESFCYAAHELYAAGIPLIVSDIPAFQDYFQHEKNAMVFDGTVSHLALQMAHLSLDDGLCARIARPYPLTENPLGDFYTAPPKPSWITGATNDLDRKSQPDAALLASKSLLLCVLCDDAILRPSVLDSFTSSLPGEILTVIARPITDQDPSGVITWFLGRLVKFENDQGEALDPVQIRTTQSLLVLQAGDSIDPGFVEIGLTTLQKQPQLTFVGSWKWIQEGSKRKIETLPFDAVPELLPIMGRTPYSRFILHTQPGRLLIDLFDVRAGKFGELAYLWKLASDSTCGLMIPQPKVSCAIDDAPDLKAKELDYLIIRDNQCNRKTRLSRLPLSLNDRSIVLRNLNYEEYPDVYLAKRSALERYLRGSILFTWLERTPRMKQNIKRILSFFKKPA